MEGYVLLPRWQATEDSGGLESTRLPRAAALALYLLPGSRPALSPAPVPPPMSKIDQIKFYVRYAAGDVLIDDGYEEVLRVVNLFIKLLFVFLLKCAWGPHVTCR